MLRVLHNTRKLCNTSPIVIFLQDMKFKHAFDLKLSLKKCELFGKKYFFKYVLLSSKEINKSPFDIRSRALGPVSSKVVRPGVCVSSKGVSLRRTKVKLKLYVYSWVGVSSKHKQKTWRLCSCSGDVINIL